MGIYRSADKEYLKVFKDYLKVNISPEEGAKVWSFYSKYIYIEDLHNYLRIITGEDTPIGFGDYNSKIVIALPTLKDESQVKFLKELFAKINLNINKIYITSYNKGDSVGKYDLEYEQVLTNEILKINPDVIFKVGDYNLVTPNIKIVDVDGDNFSKMLQLYNEETLTPEEEIELAKTKKVFWDKIKFIIKYYSA